MISLKIDVELRFEDSIMSHQHSIHMFLFKLCYESRHFEDIVNLWIFCLRTIYNFNQVCTKHHSSMENIQPQFTEQAYLGIEEQKWKCWYRLVNEVMQIGARRKILHYVLAWTKEANISAHEDTAHSPFWGFSTSLSN